jgi:hypothetical protein
MRDTGNGHLGHVSTSTSQRIVDDRNAARRRTLVDRQTGCHRPCSVGGPLNGELLSLVAEQVLQVAFEILVWPGLCIHTKHIQIKTEKQMTKTTVQRTRSLRTIAAPLIAIVLVMTACGSDGPVEDPSIPNTFLGGRKRADF